MPGIDDSRRAKIAELEAAILRRAADEEPPETSEELSELSARAHKMIVVGEAGRLPTELRIRLHGEGVTDHLVPSDQAGAILRKTQLLVRWIGARLRTLNESDGEGRSSRDALGIVEATRLYLQPQIGAGSLVFDLVASEAASYPATEQLTIDGSSSVRESLLDHSLREFVSIVNSSQADSAEDLGVLSEYVAKMGPRVASQLKALAAQVTDDEIDIDVRWIGAEGQRQKASLGRRGALAIKDAVERNRVKIDEIVVEGLLETASTGKDQVRIDTDDDSIKMKVDKELGVTLGQWLHLPVRARVERTVTWHNSGKESKDYKLLDIGSQDGDVSTSED